MHPSRRTFLQTLVAAALSPARARAEVAARRFRVRAVTAGIAMASVDDSAKMKSALEFLGRARQAFVREGFEVQTVRIATQPLAEYLPDWRTSALWTTVRLPATSRSALDPF
jgi:hypothetical protein